MTDILNKIPPQAKLEFVFTRNLVDDYYQKTEKTFLETFNGNENVLKRSYFKIDTRASLMKLETIRGFVNGGDLQNGIVIFFVIDHKIKLR